MNALEAALLGTIVAVLGAALVAAVIVGRRVIHDDGRPRLFDALRGQGRAAPMSGDEADMREVALAARRCLACTEHALCDSLLAARDWKALRAICPNTDYIDRLPPKP